MKKKQKTGHRMHLQRSITDTSQVNQAASGSCGAEHVYYTQMYN